MNRAICGNNGRTDRGHTDLHLVPLQSRARSWPVCLCIPGAGADVTSFIDVVASLGETCSVYGLQPRGLWGERVPHSTVEAAALDYIAAIDDASLPGPFHLVGHSFGGWQAFEMACALSEAGRPVAALTLLDSDAPDAARDPTHDPADLDCLQEWVDGIEQRLGHPLGIDVADLEPRTGAQRREILHRQMVKHGLLPARSGPDVLRGRLRTFSVNLRTSYCPRRPYRAPVTLVVADDPDLDASGNHQRLQTRLDGWRRWSPALRFVRVPGNHMTLMSPPHVEAVAAVIRQALDHHHREELTR